MILLTYRSVLKASSAHGADGNVFIPRFKGHPLLAEMMSQENAVVDVNLPTRSARVSCYIELD
jgi:hypothetical protein